MPVANRIREIDDALRDLAREVGASVKFENGGIHRRAIFSFNGKTRFDVLTGTPRSHTITPILQQARRTLALLGATFKKPPATERPVPQARPTGPKMLKPLRDFEPLTMTTLARPKVVAPPISLARALQLPRPVSEPVTAHGFVTTLCRTRRRRRRLRCARRLNQPRGNGPSGHMKGLNDD